MNIVDSIQSFPNGKWGEDRIFYSENFAGVIDGSTPIDTVKFKDYHSQAEWLADKLAINLTKNILDSIPNICKSIINTLKNDNDLIELEEYNQPCAVLSAIQVDGSSLICYTIGDCEIAIKFYNGEIKKITDTRIRKYSEKTKNIKKEAISKKNDIHSMIKKQLILNKKNMNIEEGYWTVAFKGDFEKKFKVTKFNLSEIQNILIYSDGFSRLFDLSRITLEDIFMEKYKLYTCVQELRCIENSQPESKEVKKQDDVAAILLEF